MLKHKLMLSVLALFQYRVTSIVHKLSLKFPINFDTIIAIKKGVIQRKT